MPYTNVQFIAFTIDTAPQSNKDGSKTYLGLQSPQEDIQARCKLMARAMQTALDNLSQSSPPQAPGTTLKVFLAPEFFFRGSTGAYEMEDVQDAISQLQKLTTGAQWQDWIFGFGSILGQSAPHLDVPPYNIDPSAKKVIYNFTLIQDGGPGSQGDQGARVVMKELMSGVDFIADKATGDGMLLANVEHFPAGNHAPGREQQIVNYDGAGIFDLAGVTWGVEICLDHHEDVSRLKQSPQTIPGASVVQLQLVPSCGMNIESDSVITGKGGYVFNCDGQVGGRSELAKVDAVGPVVLSDVPKTSDHAVSDADIVLADGSPPQVVPISDLYRSGAGKIVYYPFDAKIPDAATVPGSMITLRWRASDDYQFVFQVIYDANGNYRTVLFAPKSTKTDFYGNKYFLPLYLNTHSKAAIESKSKAPDVELTVKLVAGTAGYAHGVWCNFEVPGFNFKGVAFEFSSSATGKPPTVVF